MDTLYTKHAADHILFFKLYFLGRWDNYIEYMDGAKLLANWVIEKKEDDTRIDELDIVLSRISSPVFCGNCFRQYSTEGSSFTIGCNSCGRAGNMSYEIQQLGQLLGIKWNTGLKLATIALSELMRDNNSISLMKGMLYGAGTNEHQ